MFKLGITGGIGSGKTTGANFFHKKGAVVFDADIAAKTHLRNSPALQSRIISTFGPKVCLKNKLDFKKLSEAAFASPMDQKILNGLVWPELNFIKMSAAWL